MTRWTRENRRTTTRTQGERAGTGLTGLLVSVSLGAVLLGACGPATSAGPAATPSGTPSGTSSGPSSGATSTGATSSPASTPSSPSTTTPPAPTTAPASAVATPAVLLAPGAKSATVRDLQSRLLQTQWYEGAITDTYDEKTRAGVEGYQEKRGMPATGSVDRATWDKLVSMTRTPTSDEMNNVLHPGPALLKQGATGAQVRDLQARLKQIGWWSGVVTDTFGPQTAQTVKDFQTKRAISVTGEVDQRTKDRLTAMTRTPTSDELTNAAPTAAPVSAAGLDARCLTGRTICISKGSRQLVWVVDGKALMRFDVRFGSEYTPTREGTFAVFQKNRAWTSTIYGSSMPFSMFFSGGQAVHYSSDFKARGYAGASHGCVNVRDYNGLAALFDQVDLGDKVVVY